MYLCTMAEGLGPVPLPKNKSKNRSLGWLTIRRSRSKNKYNLQNAVPHACQHPDDRSGQDSLGYVDEDDIPKLVERLRMLESEQTPCDPEIVITTQKHLIDALRRENGALRLLRHQVELLRRENTKLKKEAEKARPKKLANGAKVKNGVPNGDISETDMLEDKDEDSGDIATLKLENERLRKSNDQLQNCLDEHKRQTNELTNGEADGHEASNGIAKEGGTNGQSGRQSPRNAGENGKKSRPVLMKGNDNGAGTSGTSLVSVNCLRKSDGNFHDCDEILEERLKSHMAAKGVDLVFKEWSPGRDHHMVTLVFCLASNDVAQNIAKALDGVSSDAEVILVVFHTASQESTRKDPETESLNLSSLSNACLVVDVFFSKRDSLYRCNQNNRAMSRLLHLFEVIC
ncbi:uncharacterized protein LOC110987148 [Acanthaster planci]|uniref:Uncharacterized protein LOC110987148 n=1 Tax=Acanthaster planci TaxID=133434 RepID=A0A8B7ZIC6_ACAPL|nr:uncharacterized protein LOC110987148 [Acanthaster planci]